MTRKEMLLVQLAEECAEIQQQVSKALRFGLTEIRPQVEETNAESIMRETADFIGALSMLQQDGYLGEIDTVLVERKRKKIEKYLKYSETVCGTLESAHPTCKIGVYYATCKLWETYPEGCASCTNYIRN